MAAILVFANLILVWIESIVEINTKQIKLLLQKFLLGRPILSKGAMVLFYGGEDVLPFVSNSAKSSNSSLLFLAILFLIVQILIALYKSFRFKMSLEYDQRLQQLVMTGFRNVFSQIVIIVAFLIFITVLMLHAFLSMKHKEIEKLEENDSYGLWMLLLLITIICCLPFKNPKLRLGIVLLIIRLNHLQSHYLSEVQQL